MAGLGYAGFAVRCAPRRNQLGFAFDYIIVCTVTGSTHAGMIVGFAEDGRQRNIIGMEAYATPAKTKVLSVTQHTAMLIELGTALVGDDGFARGQCVSALWHSNRRNQRGDLPMRSAREHDYRSRL